MSENVFFFTFSVSFLFFFFSFWTQIIRIIKWMCFFGSEHLLHILVNLVKHLKNVWHTVEFAFIGYLFRLIKKTFLLLLLCEIAMGVPINSNTSSIHTNESSLLIFFFKYFFDVLEAKSIYRSIYKIKNIYFDEIKYHSTVHPY